MLNVHENERFKVVKDDEPYILDGEPMNWQVINKIYDTVEATTSSLVNAILVADQFNDSLAKLTEGIDRAFSH